MPDSDPILRKVTLERLQAGARYALFGVCVNILLSVAKIAAGLFGNCYALIADGIESALDVFSSLLLWFGLKLAAAPPDDEHPYGHGKAEPLAAVAVSLTVLGAALLLAIQSMREIMTPHHAPAPFTLIVLVAVILIKETLFQKVSRGAERIGSSAVKSDAWHHRSDAITSATAFIGISIALIGGPGWEAADDWAALFACGLIGYNGLNLLKPAVYEVMDSAPPKEWEQQIRAVSAAVPGVLGLDKCRVRKMGLDYFVDIHVEVDAQLTVLEGHRIAHEVKDAIREHNPAVVDVLVHIEPAQSP